MESYWVFLAGLIAGATGFLVTQFWMQPVLRYRESKHSVIVELIVYANAVALFPGEAFTDSRTSERLKANRSRAAELRACNWSLPGWYRFWLRLRKEDPQIAARELIGLSNTTEHQEAASRVRAIKSALRLPEKLG